MPFQSPIAMVTRLWGNQVARVSADVGHHLQPLPSIFGVISQNSAPYLEVKTLMSCRFSLQPIDQPLVFYLILYDKTMLKPLLSIGKPPWNALDSLGKPLGTTTMTRTPPLHSLNSTSSREPSLGRSFLGFGESGVLYRDSIYRYIFCVYIYIIYVFI